jgi:hydrogenase expression/formation protein HypC
MTHCTDDHCLTCGDIAVQVQVRQLLDDDLALVDVGGGRVEEVSVGLVSAAVGDVLVVHAGEAIGVVARTGGGAA